MNEPVLPIRGDLKLVYCRSLAVLVLAAVASAAGVLFWDQMCPASAAPSLTGTDAFDLIAVLLLCSMYRLVTRLDLEAVKARFAGTVPRRAAGGVLFGLGLLFLLLDLAAIGSGISSWAEVTDQDLALWAVDLTISPALMLGGRRGTRRGRACSCRSGFCARAFPSAWRWGLPSPAPPSTPARSCCSSSARSPWRSCSIASEA